MKEEEELRIECLAIVGYNIESIEEMLTKAHQDVTKMTRDMNRLEKVLDALEEAHDQLIGAGVTEKKDREAERGMFGLQADAENELRTRIKDFAAALRIATPALEALQNQLVEWKGYRKRLLEVEN